MKSKALFTYESKTIFIETYLDVQGCIGKKCMLKENTNYSIVEIAIKQTRKKHVKQVFNKEQALKNKANRCLFNSFYRKLTERINIFSTLHWKLFQDKYANRKQ